MISTIEAVQLFGKGVSLAISVIVALRTIRPHKQEKQEKK